MELHPMSNSSLGDTIEVYTSPKIDYELMLDTPNCRTFRDPALDSDILEAHTGFVAALREVKDPQELIEIARVELATVVRFFPAEKSKNIRLGLAAWLSFSLALDDAVQALVEAGTRPENVRLGLTKAWKLFGRWNGSSSIEQPPDSIVRLSDSLQNHLRSLLSTRLLPLTFRHIRDVLMGLAEESLYRETKTWDIDHYLSIRAKTVGLRPWFAMLAITDTSIPMSEAEVLMANLKTWVTLAIGLQDDIIDLKRDLEKEDTMNFMTVLRNQANCASASASAICLPPGVDAYHKEIHTAIMYHNEAFRWANGCFDSISRCGSRTEKSQASKVYHLLSTYKTWAIESKRWKI